MAVDEQRRWQCDDNAPHEQHFWEPEGSALSYGYGAYPQKLLCPGRNPSARVVTTVVFEMSDAPPRGQRADLTQIVGRGVVNALAASGLPSPSLVTTRDEEEPTMSVPVRLMRGVFDRDAPLDDFWRGMHELEKVWRATQSKEADDGDRSSTD